MSYRIYTEDELRNLPDGYILRDDRGSSWAKFGDRWEIVNCGDGEYKPWECIRDLMLRPGVQVRGDTQ